MMAKHVVLRERRAPQPASLRKTRWRAAVSLLVAILVTSPTAAQSVSNAVAAREDTSSGTLVLRRLVSGLANPWAVATLPGGGALITERSGALWYLDSLQPGAGTLRRVAGVPDVFAVGQGGLLDIIVAPDFATSGTVVMSYAAASGRGSVTRVARAQFASSGGAPRLTNLRVIFSAEPAVAGSHHFGSRLAFDDNELLYITIGDRGDQSTAQQTSNHHGGVVRLTLDGAVPAGNPSGVARGLYSWGHRNPQGLAYDAATDTIWLHEHGPRGGDEINILSGGANYGWPVATHGVAYSGRPIARSASAPGMRDPLIHWTPSIAPSGMAFISGSRYPAWEGDLMVGALAGRHLRLVRLSGDRVTAQEVLFSGYARFRDVRMADDGYLYLVTDERNGGLYRLEPEG